MAGEGVGWGGSWRAGASGWAGVAGVEAGSLPGVASDWAGATGEEVAAVVVSWCAEAVTAWLQCLLP